MFRRRGRSLLVMRPWIVMRLDRADRERVSAGLIAGFAAAGGRTKRLGLLEMPV